MNQKVVEIKLRALSLKSIGHFKIDMIKDQGNNLNKSTNLKPTQNPKPLSLNHLERL